MKKRLLALTLATSMIMTLASCGGSDTSSSGTGSSTVSNETTQSSGNDNNSTTDAPSTNKGPVPTGDGYTYDSIHMQLAYWDAEVPNGNEPLWVKLHELVGFDVNVDWVPPASMAERTTLTISDRNQPEVIMVINNDMRSQIMNDAVRGGMFWDLTDYLPLFPNLSTIPEVIIDGMLYDGRLYGLPKLSMTSGNGLVIREDWLENLGMDLPETLDDYYEMFRAFTEDDPDGNGQNDTVGGAISGGPFVMSLTLAAGIPQTWYVDDNDEVVPFFVHEGFKDYIDWFKQLYDNKYINQDFVSTNNSQAIDNFLTGRYGSVPSSVGHASTGSLFQVVRDQGAELYVPLTGVGDDGTTYTASAQGFWGMYMISKNEVETEERLLEILTYFENLMTQEANDIIALGEEGVHYTHENGEFEWLDQTAQTLDSAGTGSTYITSRAQEILKLALGKHDLGYLEAQTTQGDVHYPQVELWYYSTNAPSPLEKPVRDVVARIIMGENTWDDFDKSVEEFYKNGGQLTIDEYTEQHRANK